MKIKISEKVGELNFGVFWISQDGRLSTLWYQTYKEALQRYNYLKTLKRQPSINVRIEVESK